MNLNDLIHVFTTDWQVISIVLIIAAYLCYKYLNKFFRSYILLIVIFIEIIALCYFWEKIENFIDSENRVEWLKGLFPILMAAVPAYLLWHWRDVDKKETLTQGKLDLEQKERELKLKEDNASWINFIKYTKMAENDGNNYSENVRATAVSFLGEYYSREGTQFPHLVHDFFKKMLDNFWDNQNAYKQYLKILAAYNKAVEIYSEKAEKNDTTASPKDYKAAKEQLIEAINILKEIKLPEYIKAVHKVLVLKSTKVKLNKENLFHAKNKLFLSKFNLTCAEISDSNFADANLWNSKLTGAKLRGSNLTGANLRNSNFTDANLRNSNLTGANLRFSNFTGAELYNSNLTGANLRGSSLTSADFRGSNLTDANLCDSNLTDAEIRGSNLTGADLSGSSLTGAVIKRSNLTSAEIRNSNLTGVYFCDSNLIGANLCGSNLTGVVFKQSNLTDVYFYGSNLTDANLCDSNLTGAGLCGSNLTGAGLCGSNLTGAKIWNSNLTDAQISSSNLIGAEIWDSNFTGTNFRNSNLSGARLQGFINLRGAFYMLLLKIKVFHRRKYIKSIWRAPKMLLTSLNSLKSKPDFTGVIYDDETEFSESFDPKKAGMENVDH